MDKRKKFLEDLKGLLEKYSATVTCDSIVEGLVESPKITVEFDDYDIDDIVFGTYIDAKQVKEIPYIIYFVPTK